MEKIKFKKLFKKYGGKEMLSKYLRGEINLTNRQIDEINRSFDSSHFAVNGRVNKSIIIGIIIALITSIISSGGYMDRISQCKGDLGHECTIYEVETFDR